MHLFMTILCGLIVLGVLIMWYALSKAKPDPFEPTDFNEQDIY
jgi:hypothetical protein